MALCVPYTYQFPFLTSLLSGCCFRHSIDIDLTKVTKALQVTKFNWLFSHLDLTKTFGDTLFLKVSSADFLVPVTFLCQCTISTFHFSFCFLYQILSLPAHPSLKKHTSEGTSISSLHSPRERLTRCLVSAIICICRHCPMQQPLATCGYYISKELNLYFSQLSFKFKNQHLTQLLENFQVYSELLQYLNLLFQSQTL